MKFYQRIIIGGLALAGLVSLLGCEKKSSNASPPVPKKVIFEVPTGGYGTRAFAAADFDGDGIADLLSSDSHGNVYFHKGLGNLEFDKTPHGPISKIPTGGYGSRAFATADFDGDGIADLLSSDGYGNVYFHKGLGNLKFKE